MQDLTRYARGEKSPAVWAVGMGFVTIAVVLVVVVMTFNVTDSMNLTGTGNITYWAVKGNLLSAAGLFGVVGIILIVSLLFNIIR